MHNLKNDTTMGHYNSFLIAWEDDGLIEYSEYAWLALIVINMINTNSQK